MSKKVYLIILAVTILLYALIVVQQMYVIEIGEFFGYIFWAVIVAGVVATVWLLLSPKKENA